jgi:asparagine synthase (glutamine-hydrolysing)
MLFVELGGEGPARDALGSRLEYRDALAFLTQTVPNQPRAAIRPLRRPLQPQQDGTALLFDGTLYNVAELAERFALRSGLASVDVAAAAFEREGEAAPAAFIGDFALVRWEPDHHRLIMAADQSGGRSLYYYQNGTEFIAASTIAMLLAHPRVPQTLDEEMLGLVLVARGHERPHRTVYRGIQMLPPGHCLRWQDGTLRVWRYWQPDPTRRIRFARDEDYVEAARELLDRAVACRLPPDGTVLSHLSGGLDSSGVTVTAARLRTPAMVHSVTSRPEMSSPLPLDNDRDFHDEWSRARQVAAAYPNITPHVVHNQPPADADEEAGGRFWSRERPMPWLFPNPAERSIADLADQLNADVVLTGDGGNVSISWDGHFSLPDRLRSGDILGWGREWRALAHRQRKSMWQLRDVAWLPLAPEWLHRGWRTLKGLPEFWRDRSAINPELGKRLGLPGVPGRIPFQSGSIDMDRRLYFLEKANHSRATWSHRSSHGARQVRSPLADIRLVDFCLALPPDQYFRNGVRRRFARAVLADRLPAPVTNEAALGFDNPEWFSWMSQRRPWMMAELERCEASSLAREVIDLAEIRRALENWPGDLAEASKLEVMLPLMHKLGKGLRMGQFIRRVEGSNA